MPTTHRLGQEATHTYWDNSLPPQLTIASGDTVVFETLEASYGGMARAVAADPPADLDPEFAAIIAASAYHEAETPMRGHALTGPVYVEGAEPGDILAVEILEIVPAAWGWTACGPGGLGLLRDEFTERTVKYWDLRDGGSAEFAPGIRVPLEPFCGVMGIALAEPGMHRTGPPSHAGGNMDIRQLTVGTTLYLPVQVPGALFSVGDAHGAQGDGEVSGTGIEMNATVTLRFSVEKGRSIRQPQFVTAGSLAPRTNTGPYFATTAHDPDLYQASREALRGMLDYLQARHGLERGQACILASACVDLRISQIVDAPNWTVTAFLPLSIFERANG